MRGLIIAAHGDGDGSESNAWALRLAQRTAKAAGFDEASVAYQKGRPHFSESLDAMKSSNVVVVPLMASRGYYSDTVLPRELAKSRRFGRVRLELLEPLGTLPGFHSLVLSRVRETLKRRDWQARDTSVLVIGHGTQKHRQSRLSTDSLCHTLASGWQLSEVLPAFLDEEPGPEEVVAEAKGDQVLVLPFLMGCGTHATKDIPRRVRTEKPLLIDQPLGTLPGVEQLIRRHVEARPRIGVSK